MDRFLCTYTSLFILVQFYGSNVMKAYNFFQNYTIKLIAGVSFISCFFSHYFVIIMISQPLDSIIIIIINRAGCVVRIHHNFVNCIVVWQVTAAAAAATAEKKIDTT